MAGSPAWQRRNARARSLGFRNYYDYRAHNYGRRAPSEPAAKGPELARLRGHRGPRDLDRVLAGGDVELINVIQTNAGPPPELEILVTRSDGSTATYRVKGDAAIGKVRKRIDDLGPTGPKIIGSPPQRRALRGTGLDDPAAFEAEAERRAEEEALAEELADELDLDPADVLDAIDSIDDDIPF